MRLPRTGVALTVAVWIALALSPAALDPWAASQLAQYMTYGLFAMSLACIWGQGGILCFGHALFFGIGAYAMALVTLGRLPLLGDSQWAGLVLAVALAAAVANLLGRLLFHGRGLSGAFFAIVTLCTAFIVEIAAQHWRFVGGFNGLIGVPPLVAPWRSGGAAYLGRSKPSTRSSPSSSRCISDCSRSNALPSAPCSGPSVTTSSAPVSSGTA